MAGYKNMFRQNMDEGYIICGDVKLCTGSLYTLYLGPGGVCVVSRSCRTSNAPALYRHIQTTRHAARIRLYVPAQEPGFCIASNLFPILTVTYWTRKPFPKILRSGCFPATPFTLIQTWTAWQRFWKTKILPPEATESGKTEHISCTMDASARHLLLARSVYYLTLFAGPLGLHRLRLRKHFSAIVYLFTGGLFFMGWLMDLLQLS